MQYKCDFCNDTGSLDQDEYLNCAHCGAADDRSALNEWSSKLPLMAPTDYRWAIHQRALAMAPKQEAAAQNPVAWLVYAEDHNGMVPQHPAYATHLHATRCASMFGQTPTEVRPLYDHAAPAVANGALTDDRKLFEAWAKDHLGQGYSLEIEEHTYANPVTRWAFVAFKAGRAALSGAKGN